MSEKLNANETYEHKIDEFEHEKALPERTGEQAQRVEVKVISRAEATKNVTEISQESDSRKVLEKLEAAEDKPPVMSRSAISREQKAITKRRSLKKLREQESLPERTLSRVIHQPVIRAISEGAGRTISRPSGLLGGGLVAFMGSGSYLVLAKYLHFTYNYSVSLALFAGGFVFGLLLELGVHLATASRRQVD